MDYDDDIYKINKFISSSLPVLHLDSKENNISFLKYLYKINFKNATKTKMLWKI